MCFARYVAALEALTSSDAAARSLRAMTSSAPALRAAVDALKAHKAALAAAAKRALAAQQGAPQGSLTKTLCDDVTGYIDVITPLPARVLAFQAALERDAEYLLRRMRRQEKKIGATAGDRTAHLTHCPPLTEYVRALLLTLQGLQADVKRSALVFPAYAAAEGKCRAFVPHMQALIALARSGSGDAGAAAASVADIARDVADVAAAVAEVTLSDVKMPAPMEAARRAWEEGVRATNAGMSFSMVPNGMGFNPTVAALAHKIEQSISALPQQPLSEGNGQAARQLVAIAKELAKGVMLLSLAGTGPEVVMTAADAITQTAKSVVKIGGAVAEKLRRKSKFGFTGVALMNANCLMNLNGFRVCAPAYAVDNKAYARQMEYVLSELVDSVLDIVAAAVTYGV